MGTVVELAEQDHEAAMEELKTSRGAPSEPCSVPGEKPWVAWRRAMALDSVYVRLAVLGVCWSVVATISDRFMSIHTCPDR